MVRRRSFTSMAGLAVTGSCSMVSRALALVQGNQDFLEGEHPDYAALVDHHERAHIVLGHDRNGLGQLAVGRDGKERVAFDLEDFADLHGSPSCCVFPTGIILPPPERCQAPLES